MKILTIYPNCSLGGMTSVYLNRCIDQPENDFSFIFINDKGGKNAFTALPNSQVRVVRKDRLNNYIEYLLKSIKYHEIRITSLPKLPLILNKTDDVKIVYEFHTSSLDIIKNEIEQLSMDFIDEIWVPSSYLKSMVESNLGFNKPINVVRNLANAEIFNTGLQPTVEYKFPNGEIPVFWIGRFDKGKNYKDFFRALSLLDKKYVGYVILSMESDPTRYAEALGEIAIYGLSDRVKFFLNLSQQEVSDYYKSAKSIGGVFCSTSLAESFGYGVLEAAMAGLPVVAYDVGGLSEHLNHGYDINMVDVGDTLALAKDIKKVAIKTKL